MLTCGVIISKNGMVLLGHPTGSHHNHRSIPKGLMDDGETPTQAAVRETLEEASIVLDASRLVPLSEQKYNGRNKTLRPFLYTLSPSEEIIAAELVCTSTFTDRRGNEIKEVDMWEWVPIENAMKIVHHTQASAMNEAFDKG